MRYVIYCAHAKEKDIINITCNPYVDLAYFKEYHGVNSLEVLTPGLSISHADYIMRNMNQNYNTMLKLLVRANRKSESMRTESIKKSMKQLRLNPIGKPHIIDYSEGLPGERSLNEVHETLKGRIMDLFELNEIIKRKGLFLDSNLQDVLQTLYIMGRVHICPSVSIEKPEKSFVCRNCEKAFSIEQSKDDLRCTACGSYLEIDEPLFASCNEDTKPVLTQVKFREHKSLTFPQSRASNELVTFLRSWRDECLLWIVPGAEDNNITSRVIREVLNNGGRCAIAVSYHSEGVNYHSALKDTFPNNSCVLHAGGGLRTNEDIVVIMFEDVKRYYKAFDLIIMSEPSVCPKVSDSCMSCQVKRAAKDSGKIIHETSTPDYDMYKRILKEKIKLITVPLRPSGKLCPEPRIMTYKALSYDNFFIPSEIMDFIIWSAVEKVRVHIIMPSVGLVRQVNEKLIYCDDIKKEWLKGSRPLILVTTLSCMYKHADVEENIIVFFADESALFNEKALIGAAGLCGRFNMRKSGEVLFIGSKESEEMYNAKLMMRFINKTAWEMGYLR